MGNSNYLEIVNSLQLVKSAITLRSLKNRFEFSTIGIRTDPNCTIFESFLKRFKTVG